MAAVEVTISGVLYDKVNRTTQPVVLIGEATLTGLGVGGGPIIPPGQPPGPVDPGYGKPMPPSQIWGGRPGPGEGGSWVPRPPYVSGGPIDPYPDAGLPIPQPPLPPDFTPPPPGSPPIVVGGEQPVHPIVPPPFIVVRYPGMGLVVVPQPVPPPAK